MNQRTNSQPQADATPRMRGQPAGNQQARKPGVASNVAKTAQMKKQTVAPPAYRPQAEAKAAQPQTASAAQNRKPPLSAQAGNPIQMKNETRQRPSALSNRAGVIQRVCGKCGNAYHTQASCTASAEERAAYFTRTRTHGWHGKNKSVPKKIKEKQVAKSAAKVAATKG